MKKIISGLFALSLIFSGVALSAFEKVEALKASPTYPQMGEECLENTDFSNELAAFNNVNDFTENNFVNLMVERTTDPSECRSVGGAVKLQYDSQDGHLNTADFPAIWQDVYVKPQTYYLWSAHIKRLGSASNGVFSIGYRNPLASDKWVAVSQNLFENTTYEWGKVSILIYTAELTAIRASMHVQCKSTGQDGWYLIDDTSLIEVDPNTMIDTETNAPTNVEFADFSRQYVNDPSFENAGTSINTNTLEHTMTWKSFSWAGTDRNGWGSDGSLSNVYMTFNHPDLVAGEKPTIGQDVKLDRNTYYVVSFYAKRWEVTNRESYVTVAFQDSNGVNSGTDNNTAMFKKNLDSVKFESTTTSWYEYSAVLYSGDYTDNRLVIFTESLDYDGGSINGYHIDNVRLWKAKEPEEAKFTISAGYQIGKPTNNKVTIKFKDSDKFVNVPFGTHVKTHYKFSNPGVFSADLKNTLVPVANGNTSVSVDVEIFGKTITSNTMNLVVTDSNKNNGNYLETLEVELNQAISTTEYRTLQIYGLDKEYAYVDWSQMNLSVVADDPSIIYVRLLTTGYHVLGISKGITSVYVTAEYMGSVAIKSIEFTIDTDNYLIDGGFEAQNQYSFWKFSGNGGGSGDDSQTNIYKRSGYANIWTMAPIFWDGNVKNDADIKLSQEVEIPAGKYSLSVFISRYVATGVDGQMSTKGGMVTLSVTKVDEVGNALMDPIYREFDTSYGANEYGKLSLVFDASETARYEVAIKVKGDAQYGLGMQIDDFELTSATYPLSISADLGEDVTTVDVDSIYTIFVYALYEDGRVEQLTTDLRFFFDDFSIACVSNGFLIPRKAGTTICTVRATILDQVYETTFEVVVVGGEITPPPTNNNIDIGLIIGLSAGGVALLAVAIIVPLVLIKRRKAKGE